MEQKTLLSVVLAIIFTATGCHANMGCGRVAPRQRIVGGEDAMPGDYPWMVSIQIDGYGHICGGSLINERWVITAAHCMPYINMGYDYIASLGRHNYTEPHQNEISISVMNVYDHPDYHDGSLANDISLLELEHEVTFTPYIHPLCLLQSGSYLDTGTLVYATGWGDLEEGAGQTPDVLQEVMLPIVGQNQCECIYGSYLVPNTICAGLPEGGKDSCQGDSGGPLKVLWGDVWVEVGVVSYGPGCARPGQPGIYTDISDFEEWILSTVTSGTTPEFVYVTEYNDEHPDLEFTCPVTDYPETSTTFFTFTYPTSLPTPPPCHTTTTTTTTKPCHTTTKPCHTTHKPTCDDDDSIFGSAEKITAPFLCVMALLLLAFA